MNNWANFSDRGAGKHLFTELLHLMNMPPDQKIQRTEVAHDAHHGDQTHHQNQKPRLAQQMRRNRSLDLFRRAVSVGLQRSGD
jgi:hypothetical protein